MNLDTMLDKCRREQWKVGDLDWSGTPREMSKDEEIAIVQYFTDMAGIERLAGALFLEQQRRTEDPKLEAIFATFVRDEVRHAHAAQMLADYYDVHHYRPYEMSASLRKFAPHFIDAIKYLSPEIANAYITGGELMLDIALLRSLNDHVHDDMSQQAMNLINRDESRHIAIDYHMVEYYSSPEFLAKLETEAPKSLRDRAAAFWAFANVLWFARPFFQDVFFRPMQVVDPSGKRLREAVKRMQLLGAKPGVAARPFTKFMLAVQTAYNHPVLRVVFGRLLERIGGVNGEFLRTLYTEEEFRRAERLSFDRLAEEALAAKSVA
jgi:hypothetical protein